MTTSDLPLLAIVHGEGSVSAMELKQSAAAVCDVVWIVDSSTLDDPLMVRLLRKLGTTIDIAGMSGDEAADAVRPLQPHGIVAYADAQMPTASDLGEQLGLDYHDRVVTERLTDKVVQRQALRDGGVAVPRSAAVPASPSAADIDAFAAAVTFPVVLKPRHGASSRDTVLIRDLTQLGQLLSVAAPMAFDAMVIEEYLVGASPPPSPDFADYASVESVVVSGTISHMAVSGRTHPDEPFRETGLVIPSDFASSTVEAVLEAATQAIEALGVRIGFLHTEIKVTPSGPRLIEVNGRLGGFVPPAFALATSGVNVIEMSQRVALGAQLRFTELIPTDRVAYAMLQQPPQWAGRVVSVEGLDRLAAFPGVAAVTLSRQPGDAVDWRKGTQEYVYVVLGSAADHDGVLAVRRFMDEEVTVTYA
jgi:biotin carboxylase